ncbi:hypothetical protein WME99_38085 [Sorangium sp. So ce136]|uniref:hypothetical protein n=1 Tax=Sorangium sp. So ce136 TaxID=3133284 RepID=UPI003F0004DB
MTRMKLVGVLMAGLALAACGGDDDGGDDGSTGGGDLDGKQLGSLTAADSEALCQDLAASVTVTKEDLCEVAGAYSALGGADCEATTAECMSQPEQPSEGVECSSAGFTGCTATVAEYKACMTAQVNTLKAISCTSPPDTSGEQPAACAPLNDKCPEVLGTGGEGA